MPLYEFECEKCHKVFEELVSSTSTELPKCPDCQDNNVHKKVSAGAIRAGGFGGGSFASSAPSCSTSGG